jgi:hypothetical protein
MHYAQNILADSKAQACIWRFGKLHRPTGAKTSSVVSEVLDETAAKTRQEIRHYCGMENHRPFTMNKEEYITAKEENVTKLALLRHSKAQLPCTKGTPFYLEDIRGSSHQFSATEDNLLAVLSAYGIHLSSAKELVRIYVDEYQAELDVIAHVVAYFDISSKRLIDDIPKIFEKRFAHGFGQELKKVLTTKLNLIGDPGLDTCSRYIRDEPEVQEKRRQLRREQRILMKASKTMEEFHR